MRTFESIPKKYHPKGFDIIYEDRDIIAGNKAAGFLSVGALWNKDKTIHRALNDYVRKGQLKSRKCVYVVHRLDQATTGVLVFAKTQQSKDYLKENWTNFEKVYFAVVNGILAKKEDMIESHLAEDEDYFVRSVSGKQGKPAKTFYQVIRETDKHSLLRIRILTGRKNQIRVHMADIGHPVLGDSKYGKSFKAYPRLALHAFSLTLSHPFSGKRLNLTAPVPAFFKTIMGDFSTEHG